MENNNRTGLEVAIIGMAGRFPGAENISTFWENLIAGKETTTIFTDDELEASGIKPEIYNQKNYIRVKGILDNPESFDAAFFDYKENEARIMDPQMKLLHEITYAALEDAGYDPYNSQNELIGFYTGSLPNHYWEFRASQMVDDSIDKFEILHLVDKDFSNSRIAYKLNFLGPCITIATACSTSLVAVHTAVRALLTGECKLALCGGVSILLPYKSGYMYKPEFIFSKDGHCRTFDKKASGIIAADGGGIVVLKLLENAIADNDHIYAVIKGSAVTSDGSGRTGYSAPNIEGMSNAVKLALRFSRVDSETISYIETHGTGTLFGDQIEVEALKSGLGSGKKQFCRIGSHKPNIGYLGPASGITSLIKVALSLYNKKIPPSINCTEPNPEIDFENSPFIINTELQDWQRNDTLPLRAGVNNIAVGGINAHVIMEEAPQINSRKTMREWKLLTLSAKSAAALDKMATRLSVFFSQNPGVNLADAAYTLQTGRKEFNYRRTVLCSDTNQATNTLITLDGKYTRTAKAMQKKQICYFLFPDYGFQYIDAGVKLYHTEKVFQEKVESGFSLFKTAGYDLKPFLFSSTGKPPGETTIDTPGISRAVCFILEYAFAGLLMHWGVVPAGLLGYGTGLYTAACLSGIITLEDAVKMIISSNQILEKNDKAHILKVNAPREKIQELTGDPGIKVSLIAELSPSLCLVAGNEQALTLFSDALAANKIDSVKVKKQIIRDPFSNSSLQEFKNGIRDIKFNKGIIPVLSLFSGTWLNTEMSDLIYREQEFKQTVNIRSALSTLMQEANAVFVEIGDGKWFTPLINQHEHKGDQIALNVIPHFRERVSDDFYFLDKIARLWGQGVNINWKNLYNDEIRYKCALPAYPF